MIKNYNLFLIKEDISISNDDVIEIIKSLEGKNKQLVNKLVNNTDKNGKSLLMSIAQTSNEALIDYILKFDVDINYKNKKRENVLFYCKNVKIFNKFYKLGVDVKYNNVDRRNMLTNLAVKKIFNVELYQQLINDGIDINYDDIYGESVLTGSILNKNIVELLIRNNVNLNDDRIQYNYLSKLFDKLKYFDKSRATVLKIFEILFENGMKVINIKKFAYHIVDLPSYINTNFDIFSSFLIPLKKYISDDIMVEIFNNKIRGYNQDLDVKFSKELLNIGLYPKLYERIKQWYGGSTFQTLFADYIAEHPYIEDSNKYNL